MFKFLRKYNKYILAVGGTLLLITFLIPFAFTELLPAIGRGGGTWARIGPDQEQVPSRELLRVQRELQLIQSVPLLAGLGAVDQPEYWYLLVREAQEAGFVGPPTVSADPQSEQLVTLLATVSGESIQFARETVAKLQGVGQMIEAYRDSGKFSDRRLKHRARRMFHNASAQVVVIEASAPQTTRAFSERELADQLEQYGDVAPGEGDMGFGYRLPDRAKLEWLVVPAETVRAMIEQSDQLNPIALRIHWQDGADENRFPERQPGAEVPDEVREDLLVTLTNESLEEIAKHANNQLRLHRRGLTQGGSYQEIPEGWRGLDFQAMALELQETFGVALPEYHAVGDRWLASDEQAQLPGLGTATTDKFGQTPVALPELVDASKELGGSATISIQQGIAGPPLRGSDGSVYLFRITDTDPSRPPHSVDEVREELVADLNKLAHYQELVEAADAIRAVAVAEGLLAAALLYDTTVEPTSSLSLGFSQDLPKIGANEEVVEAIIDRAMELPQNVPLSSLPQADRILVLPVEDRLSLLIADLTEQRPLTDETYALFVRNGIVQSRLLQEEIGQSNPIEEAFSYEALAARHNFELSAGATTQADPTTQPDADQDAQAGLSQ